MRAKQFAYEKMMRGGPHDKEFFRVFRAYLIDALN